MTRRPLPDEAADKDPGETQHLFNAGEPLAILESPAHTATDLHHLSIAEAAKLIEHRRLSPVELAQAHLDRIETFDPQLNAYLLVTPERALAQARAAGPRLPPATTAARCLASLSP